MFDVRREHHTGDVTMDANVGEGRLTLGLAAVRIGGGVQGHHLTRLANRNAIPHEKAGRIRLVKVSDLEVIRAECELRGYWRAEEMATA